MFKASHDGWVSLPGPEGTDGLHARTRRDASGRVVITDVFLHGSNITAETLRSVSPARIEARLNMPLSEIADRGDIVTFAAQQWAHLRDDDGELTLAELRARTPDQDTPRPRGWRLARPDGSDPDGFYRKVAQAYGEYAGVVNSPAKMLASEADVPVTTAHRWVREARRRGFLPAGRKGRAG